MRILKKGKLLFACMFLSYIVGLKAQENRPNVILILADDLGMECITSFGGTSYQTPNIDKLAAKGIKFHNCHSQPLCTPSRVQIMTGMYNVRNYTTFGKLASNQTTFGNIFSNAGYKTAIAGKWQLGREKDYPQHFGFDESCLWQQSLPRKDKAGHDTRFSNPILTINGEVKRFTNGEYGPDIVSDFMCDFIEKNKHEPFFAYYPMILTHCPFVPTPDSKDWDPKSMGSLDYKGDTAYFSDMVSYMDMLVGKIIAKVDELELSENTLIIFTGDNGTDQPVVSMFKGEEYIAGKGKTTDNGTHVPLIVSWEGTIEQNKECIDLVDFSDFLPTMCEAAKLEIPFNLTIDGTSFFPQLLGKEGSPREWTYCWYRTKPEKKLREFTRNHDFKLYATGEFYNVNNDFFEKKPIPLKHLNEKEKSVYETLNKALGVYKGVRMIQ